jgi:hypothetical protein
LDTPEIPGVVDRGLGPQRPALFVVLLDLGVLVLDVQGRDHSLGDDPGAEPARGRMPTFADDAAVEDQTDLVGAADVEVVVEDLLEKDPPVHRAVEHLNQEELRLQDGQLIPVSGGLVLVGGSERVGQDLEPFTQQRLDMLRAQTVADRLQRRHVIARGESVVQRLVADPGLGRLSFGPFVAVDAFSELRRS